MAGRPSSLKFLGHTFSTPDEDAGKPVAEEKKEKKGIKACGLCGKTKKLTKTSCCHNWICDDQHKYVLFSYSRVSCHRNHDRYTLCSYHHNERHPGHWQDCKKCKNDFDLPYYVEIGTNDYNFEKLKNPPKVNACCKPDMTAPGPRTIWLNPSIDPNTVDPNLFNMDPNSVPNLLGPNFFGPNFFSRK